MYTLNIPKSPPRKGGSLDNFSFIVGQELMKERFVLGHGFKPGMAVETQ
jgi:hypothetical protein